MTDTTRRSVLTGAAGVSAAVALAACGTEQPQTPTNNATPAGGVTSKGASPSASAARPASSAAAAPGAGAGAGNTATGGLAAVADIPVGGGKIFAKEKVVVTQPTAGTIKAFSTACTHQGCPVSKVERGVIVCTCHNSSFRIADGSVAAGPATRPLAGARVRVQNGRINLA